MLKRLVAAPLWFVATMALYELVIYFAGGPHEFGPILGAVAAVLVATDPRHILWERKPSDLPEALFDNSIADFPSTHPKAA